MQRTAMRALSMGLITGALVLGSGHRALRADDDPVADPETKGIAWVAGWADGVKQAQKDGKLIFLYFGRHAPR